jgi:hypothetical protein
MAKKFELKFSVVYDPADYSSPAELTAFQQRLGQSVAAFIDLCKARYNEKITSAFELPPADAPAFFPHVREADLYPLEQFACDSEPVFRAKVQEVYNQKRYDRFSRAEQADALCRDFGVAANPHRPGAYTINRNAILQALCHITGVPMNPYKEQIRVRFEAARAANSALTQKSFVAANSGSAGKPYAEIYTGEEKRLTATNVNDALGGVLSTPSTGFPHVQRTQSQPPPSRFALPTLDLSLLNAAQAALKPHDAPKADDPKPALNGGQDSEDEVDEYLPQ